MTRFLYIDLMMLWSACRVTSWWVRLHVWSHFSCLAESTWHWSVAFINAGMENKPEVIVFLYESFQNDITIILTVTLCISVACCWYFNFRKRRQNMSWISNYVQTEPWSATIHVCFQTFLSWHSIIFFYHGLIRFHLASQLEYRFSYCPLRESCDFYLLLN